MNVKERILALHKDGEGLGVRAIARDVGRSATQVSRVLAAAGREATAGDLAIMLRDLTRAVRSFAIERDRQGWKIINYELPLGAAKETDRHSDLPTVIRHALALWRV